MINRASALWGVCLALMIGLAMAAPAQADKVAEPLVFDSDRAAIAVLTLYETTPASQATAVQSFYKVAKSFYKAIPGFYGLALLSSVDGDRVAELSQWQDLASYETFQASLASDSKADYTQYYEKYADAKGGKGGKGKDDSGGGLGEPFLSLAFAVDEVLAPPGMVAAIPSTPALVQISELSLAPSGHQADVVAAAETALATVPQLYPAPRTTVLLRGIDANDVVLLATWGGTAEFSDPSLIPQIALPASVGDGDDELAIAADSHLYQTVKVLIPKPAKYGKN